VPPADDSVDCPRLAVSFTVSLFVLLFVFLFVFLFVGSLLFLFVRVACRRFGSGISRS
jgi:hypothetical protein